MHDTESSTFKAMRAPQPPEFKHTRRVESPYPKGPLGDFTDSYLEGDANQARSRANHPTSRARRIAVRVGTSALLAVSAGAVIKNSVTQNHNAAVAAGLMAPAATDAQHLTTGSKDVAIVTEPVGVSETTAAAGIANNPSILQVQGLINAENGSTTTQQSEVAIPTNDLNQKTRQALPDGGQITPNELAALQTGASLTEVRDSGIGN